MISRLFFFFMLFLSSCSLFKAAPTLSNKDIQQLLASVKAEGEGRGRLTVNNQQNVFSFEAVLKENSDWLLAVSIPLHGEEVMILPQLQKDTVQDSSMEGFEARIDHALKKELKTKTLTAQEFTQSLRSLLRFILASKVGGAVKCQKQENYRCRQGDKNFEVQVLDKEIIIHELTEKNFKLLAKAKSLTDSFFTRTEFYLVSNDGKEALLTLELFWK